MNIMKTVEVPPHENCSLIIVFRNSVGSSDPLILTISGKFNASLHSIIYLDYIQQKIINQLCQMQHLVHQ